jgi:hypothetical protein
MMGQLTEHQASVVDWPNVTLGYALFNKSNTSA